MHWSRGEKVKVTRYENRHGRTVASDHDRYCVIQYAAVLPAAVACEGLHVDTTAYVFQFVCMFT